jgi:hypothetical protein
LATNWISNVPYSRGLNVKAAPESTIRPAQLMSFGLLYLKYLFALFYLWTIRTNQYNTGVSIGSTNQYFFLFIPIIGRCSSYKLCLKSLLNHNIQTLYKYPSILVCFFVCNIDSAGSGMSNTDESSSPFIFFQKCLKY